MSCLIFPGSKKTVGEFFNPGLNCSDILDQRDDAKDGFYWVTLNPLNPVKVGYWCTFFHKGFFHDLFIFLFYTNNLFHFLTKNIVPCV